MDEPTARQRELAAGAEWAIVVATFYDDLARRLVDGAMSGFAEQGADPDRVSTYEVPGAFELPLGAQLCAATGRFAGVACLGVVIRGETDHYDFVCSQAARGVGEVNLRTGVPCSFGLITCATREQAEARAGGDRRDQGRNAAIAAVRMHLLGAELRA